MRPLAFYDIEVYPDYFLVAFERESDHKQFYLEVSDTKQPNIDDLGRIALLLKTHTLVGYNCVGYDARILTKFIQYTTALSAGIDLTTRLYKISKFIILSKNIFDVYNAIPIHAVIDQIDLMPIAPDPGRVSLKMYGARCHVDHLVNLPYDPDSPTTEKMREDIRAYCYVDIEVTRALYEKIKERIDMRRVLGEEYGVNVMNKTDAQIAEAIVRKECKVWNKPGIPKTVIYTPPEWMQFPNYAGLNKLLEFAQLHEFTCDENGKVNRPPEFRRLIQIGDMRYQLGVGGLHSQEKVQAVVKQDDEDLIDLDVASYYPSIILNSGLYPRGLGERFLDVYQTITTKRLNAKAAKQKELSEGLKIVINGSFGKFSSRYSVMFDPEALLYVTLTGQLALLMLIEKLHNFAGCTTISANTDGLIVRVPHQHKDEYLRVIGSWQRLTRYTLEAKHYQAVYSKDVSNYIAVSEDGAVKGRGFFNTDRPLQTNPHLQICVEACINHVTGKKSIEQTILTEEDIRKFVIVRNVTGGARWHEQNFGKVVRWVWVKGDGGRELTYAKNGNKVPYSSGSVPIMWYKVGGVKPFLDRERYIQETHKILSTIGLKEGR